MQRSEYYFASSMQRISNHIFITRIQFCSQWLVLFDIMLIHSSTFPYAEKTWKTCASRLLTQQKIYHFHPIMIYIFDLLHHLFFGSYFSFKLVECSIGMEAYLMRLCKRTNLKLRLELSMNSLHELGQYSCTPSINKTCLILLQ